MYVIKRDLNDNSDGAHLTSFRIEFQTEEEEKKTSDHQVLPYCVQVYGVEAWCMSWSECCGYAMAFSAAYQRHFMVQYCCGSGSTIKLLCQCFLHILQIDICGINVFIASKYA